MLNQITMRAARVNAGLTQPQMADMMDKSDATIRAWERDEKMPKADEFKKYCEICGLETSDVRLPEVFGKTE